MSVQHYEYEESVQWLRSQPEMEEMVRLCYLDEDNHAAAQRFAASEEFAEIIQMLRLNGRKCRVLDVGCGNGIASYAFASLGHQVDAIDPEPSNDVGYGAARRLAGVVHPGTITVTEAFVEELPFPDNTFDVVYTRQAVHHFGDLQQGLAECHRVLKPGGMLLATREHVVDNEQQLQQFLANHLLHQKHGGENAYPLQQYQSALQIAGFRSVQSFGPYDTVINHFPESNQELRIRLRAKLRRRLGLLGFISPFVSRFNFVEQRFRRSQSLGCTVPGRLYSFLCVK
jgi:ubiquinone/menaquinone biosynthesis C-methylase UbiE